MSWNTDNHRGVYGSDSLLIPQDSDHAIRLIDKLRKDYLVDHEKFKDS